MASDVPCHVQFEHLKAVRGGEPVFSNLSGKISRNSNIALWGENGVGKTTLLEVLAGWQKPEAGRITWFDTPAERPILVPTHGRDMIFPWYSVDTNLLIFEDLAEIRPAEGESIAELRDAIICFLGLSDLLERPAHALSEGQQARVAIACGFLFRPNILMVDETIVHLDWQTQCALAECLKQYRLINPSTSFLFVAHAASPILNLTTEWWHFERANCLSNKKPHFWSAK